jgi:7,8-dihydropterin-6-yl-methyl-4-(beta-D-ribofuranosyl)aminobenzene 5'-phosphate synthase
MVKALSLRVLVEDSTRDNRKLAAKHGLSFLIEGEVEGSKKVRVLMDTGPSADVLAHNLKAMSIDLQNVDLIVLSHGHYDHTGGLIQALHEIGKETLMIAHPKTFELKLKLEPKLKFIGSPFKLSEVENAGGVALLSKSPVAIAKGVSTSGEIKRVTTFEVVEGFWTIDEELFVNDDMLDDQALFMNIEDKGLAVISGCAHAGIINTIKHGQKVMGINDVYAVIGGFHLKNASDEQINSTIEELVHLSPKIVAPCHCTGSKTIKRFLKDLKGRCDVLRTGDSLAL